LKYRIKTPTQIIFFCAYLSFIIGQVTLYNIKDRELCRCYKGINNIKITGSAEHKFLMLLVGRREKTKYSAGIHLRLTIPINVCESAVILIIKYVYYLYVCNVCEFDEYCRCRTAVWDYITALMLCDMHFGQN